MKYSIIGLGKLGASMAAAIASRGFEVIGVDVDPNTLDAIREGRAPVYETDLERTLQQSRDRIRVTDDCEQAVLQSDLTFVVVPTPSDDKGAFVIDYAAAAFESVGRALATKKDFHNVVLTSTVLPGATRFGLLPVLERASGKTCGRDFGLCYSPEFIALGTVIRDFLNPDFVLIGEHDVDAGDHLERAYAEIHQNPCVTRRMTIENAELTKLAVNTFLTTKISFANLLCRICERLPGGDVDVVTEALGSDSRIGSRYLKGALGYGGPCFPRDNAALAYIAEQLGVAASIPQATDSINRSIAQSLVDLILRRQQREATVAVLGLAYKPASNVVEQSQGVEIVRALQRAGVRVVAYDPLVSAAAASQLAPGVVLSSCAEAIDGADVVLIATPDPEFAALRASDFKREGQPRTVIDTWRILDDVLEGQGGIDYIPYGRSTGDGEAGALLAKLWA